MKKKNNLKETFSKIKKGTLTLQVVATMMTFSMIVPAVVTSVNTNEVVYAASNNVIADIVPTFQVTSRTPKKVSIKINTINEASYYKIYRSTSSNGSYKYVGVTSNDTYTDTGLSKGKTYYYRIKAYQKNQSSKYSKKVKVNSSLDKVTSLKATYTNSNVKLQWSNVTDATKYRIYRATTLNGNFNYIGSTSSLSYTDSEIKEGTTYYYKVRGMKTISKVKYFGAYSESTKVTTNTNQNSNTSAQSFVEEVLQLINEERSKYGLSTLTTNTSLQNAAYQRAIETKELFSHTRPDGTSCFTVLEDFKVSYRTAGENIAYGQKTPEAVMNSWMNSEGHRANILSESFGKVGIGCYYSGGTYYWTQMFTN